MADASSRGEADSASGLSSHLASGSDAASSQGADSVPVFSLGGRGVKHLCVELVDANVPFQAVVVETPEDSLMWADRGLTRSEQVIGAEVLQELITDCDLTCSGAFEGVKTTAIACALISKACERWLDAHGLPTTRAPTFQSIWSWEKNWSCQNEILALDDSSGDQSCLFGDILLCTPDEHRKKVGLDGGVEWPASKLEKILPYCDVKVRAKCKRHCRVCRVKKADIHFAGTSCTDHSSFGKNKKFRGPTAKLFFLWCAMRRKLREKVVIHENVVLFGLAKLRQHLGDLYITMADVTDPETDGYAGTRKRQYTLLILRCLFEGHVIEDKLADSAGSQSIISPARVDRVVTHTMNLPTTRSKLFAAKCGHTWHAYAVGSGEELERDLTWARQRLSVKERWAKPTTTKYVDDGQDSWLGAFTVSERDRFDLYQSMWPNEACDVRQNPLERPGVRSRNGKLSCLMAGMGIIFSPELGRWLIPIELWLTMGFPVTPAGVSRTGVVCQFSRGFPNAPRTRTRASQLKQIGNAMHVESVGSVLLTAFLKLAPLLRTRSKNAASSGCPCGPSCSKKQKR